MFVLNVDSNSPSSSGSESSSDEQKLQKGRPKREITWYLQNCLLKFTELFQSIAYVRCDLETDFGTTQGPSSAPPMTNPTFGNRMQLYSRTRHFLAVYPDGKVRGTQDKNDLHTHLELINVGFPGHLLIKGLLTNLYVSINAKGRPFAQGSMEDSKAVFIETINGFYLAYLSRHYAHQGWYLGIKKSGRMKNGKKTALHQKAVQYLKQRKHFQ